MPNNIKNGHWCLKCSGKEKLTIEEMRKIAEARGGICLSTKYINIATRLKWQCKERHIWEASPQSVSRGNWCLKCSGKEKLTIEEMRKIAKKLGGKCLSDKYINNRTKLKWQCKDGHIWEARPYHVKSGHWCRVCANLREGKRKNY